MVQVVQMFQVSSFMFEMGLGTTKLIDHVENEDHKPCIHRVCFLLD